MAGEPLFFTALLIIICLCEALYHKDRKNGRPKTADSLIADL